MRHWVLVSALIMFSVGSAHAAVKGEEVEYRQGDVTLKGYRAYDDSVAGKRPGVLVVHEWWGHNAYARKRADMLAELGYTAFAVDMYGDGKTADHPDNAGSFAGEIRKNMATVGKDRFLAAMEVLQSHATVDDQRIAAIGYCFGGGTVLHMARYGLDLDGVVSFHGGLATETPAELGKVKAKVLVLNGADDPMVTPEQIEDFQNEMGMAGVPYRFVNFEGAVHAFTNPEADSLGKEFGIPVAYNAEADQRSWQLMRDFLNEIFE